MMVEVDADELETMRSELKRLWAREDELLERNTQLVELARSHSIRARVAQFHHAMDLPVRGHPQVPPDDRVRLRLRVITEEVFEMLEACEIGFNLEVLKRSVSALIDNAPLRVNLVEFVDALCDLDYFVEGTRLEFGVDGAGVLEEVHRANMAKLGGPKRADGKQMKPPGWQPPDIERVLRDQGWLG
jgi:predicted HAD superfamily Cof-like phosphohydrolase